GYFNTHKMLTRSLTQSSSTTADAGRAPSRPIHAGTGFLVFRVGVDDVRDEPVAHHIHAGQLGDVDVVDAVQNVDRRTQAGPGASREVDLGEISGDDHLRPEAQPGEEHLHLLGGGVLRLVEHDERRVKAATPHVRQWRHLNYPGGHQLWDQLR